MADTFLDYPEDAGRPMPPRKRYFYYDDEPEPEDDGRPQLPYKPRYEPEAPAGPRLTFAHERAQAIDGAYVSPAQPPERPGADLRAWGADAGRAAIAEHAAARAEERRRQTEQTVGQWRTSVFKAPPGDQQLSKRDDLLDELRSLGEQTDERQSVVRQQQSAG